MSLEENHVNPGLLRDNDGQVYPYVRPVKLSRIYLKEVLRLLRRGVESNDPIRKKVVLELAEQYLSAEVGDE